MGILGVNVSLLRKRTGLSQQQLAKRLNVGTTTVNNIETGYIEAPAPKLLEALANAFDTTCEGLLGLKPLDIAERARMVYVVDSVSADKPFVELDKIVGSVFIDRDKLRGYEYFGLRIKDNAMFNKRICAGDIVIIRRGALIKNGDIIMATVSGEKEAVVRTYHEEENIVTLKAENDSGMYPDISINLIKERVNVIGKAVKCEFNL